MQTMKNHIQEIISIYKKYNNIPATEPLDSDEAKKLINIIDIEIEYNEGNISQKEHELLTTPAICTHWREIDNEQGYLQEFCSEENHTCNCSGQKKSCENNLYESKE